MAIVWPYYVFCLNPKVGLKHSELFNYDYKKHTLWL